MDLSIEFEKLGEAFERERLQCGRASRIMILNKMAETGKLILAAHKADKLRGLKGIGALADFHFGAAKHPGTVSPTYKRGEVNFAHDVMDLLAECDATITPDAPMLRVALEDPEGQEVEAILAREQEERMDVIAKACRRLADMVKQPEPVKGPGRRRKVDPAVVRKTYEQMKTQNPTMKAKELYAMVATRLDVGTRSVEEVIQGDKRPMTLTPEGEAMDIGLTPQRRR